MTHKGIIYKIKQEQQTKYPKNHDDKWSSHKKQQGGEDDEWIKHFGWTDPLNNPSTGLYRRLKQTRKNLFDL